MEGPYRAAPGGAIFEAPSRDGAVRLVTAPDRLVLELGARARIVVADRRVLFERAGRGGRRARPRELAHGGGLEPGGERVFLARGVPGRELAIWWEPEPGVVERLAGVRPLPLLDPEALAALRALDRVGRQLGRALGGEAIELGAGQHRVLLVGRRSAAGGERVERLLLFARPVFRERPRRVLEVCRDGTLVVPGRGRRADQRARFESRFGVTVSGDRILFAEGDGRDVASVWLPWIAPEDREELVRRFGELVDPAPPESSTAAAIDPGGLRPWRSGLGRLSPAAALLPAPLPFSVVGRFRR